MGLDSSSDANAKFCANSCYLIGFVVQWARYVVTSLNLAKANKGVQVDEPANVALYPWDLTPPLLQKTTPGSGPVESSLSSSVSSYEKAPPAGKW